MALCYSGFLLPYAGVNTSVQAWPLLACVILRRAFTAKLYHCGLFQVSFAALVYVSNFILQSLSLLCVVFCLRFCVFCNFSWRFKLAPSTHVFTSAREFQDSASFYCHCQNLCCPSLITGLLFDAHRGSHLECKVTYPLLTSGINIVTRWVVRVGTCSS